MTGNDPELGAVRPSSFCVEDKPLSKIAQHYRGEKLPPPQFSPQHAKYKLPSGLRVSDSKNVHVNWYFLSESETQLIRIYLNS